jgi:hypothetical protein
LRGGEEKKETHLDSTRLSSATAGERRSGIRRKREWEAERATMGPTETGTAERKGSEHFDLSRSKVRIQHEEERAIYRNHERFFCF